MKRALSGAVGCALVLVLSSCRDAPTAPTATNRTSHESIDQPAALAQSTAREEIAVAGSAIEDALIRLVPMIDADMDTRGLLAALRQVRAALDANDSGALARATAHTHGIISTLRDPNSTNPEVLLHLDMIELALDRAASLGRSRGGNNAVPNDREIAQSPLDRSPHAKGESQ